MSGLSAPPSVSDFTIKCVESKQLFAAVESNDKDEFLKLYSELPPRSRPHVWQLRKSDRGDTLVHIGARLGLSWLVGLAVSENADVALHSHHNKQPLHDAAQTGAAECVKILLCSNRLPVDPLKRADWTPLMLACAASANKLDQQIMISTPSLHRFTDCVELLLQHGADPSFTNKDGWNCLHSEGVVTLVSPTFKPAAISSLNQ
ncbi:ankyrin repeat protein [Opisthorchis viverrini]|uniref:Ankyrin repeat protein n=1 Tax=Opisthorchis viverrini TaxID=6198 RepID=A0A1S8WTS5_OPIVI|nr:ankyrin repeat protein [Opisthorchis viverrini]